MAYVYRHIRLDKNEPFYIGIGTDKYFKRAKANSKRNPIWKNIARKTEFEVEILFDNLPLQDAKNKEVEFINLYGRIADKSGSLANISGGGDGLFGVPQEFRDKYSVRFSGVGNPFYGKKHSEETRRRLSEVSKNRKRNPLSEETKLKISEKNKGSIPPLKGKKDLKGALARTGIKHPRWKGVVVGYKEDGSFYKEFSCNKEAANFFGSNNPNFVRRVVVGERHEWKGYKFKTKHP